MALYTSAHWDMCEGRAAYNGQIRPITLFSDPCNLFFGEMSFVHCPVSSSR